MKDRLQIEDQHMGMVMIKFPSQARVPHHLHQVHHHLQVYQTHSLEPCRIEQQADRRWEGGGKKNPKTDHIDM